MIPNLDTFLVALYSTVDDLYQKHYAPHKPKRRGKNPDLSDSEVLTLVICAQWHGTSQRAFIRYAAEHWRSYFPRLLSQSACNRRSRDLAGVLTDMVARVAQDMKAYVAPYQAMDTVPVPLMRRRRGHRHRLFGAEAAIGRGGCDRDWYYGCKLLLSVTPQGVCTGFVLAPANAEDRWVAESFLCWRHDVHHDPLSPEEMSRRRNGRAYVGPTGPLGPRHGVGQTSAGPYVADNGFFGSWWQSHWRTDYGAWVLTPRDYAGIGGDAGRRAHAGWRQIVETINGHLERVFGLHFPGARSLWGLQSRIAAKLAALNLGIWLNRYFGRPDLAFATLFNG